MIRGLTFYDSVERLQLPIGRIDRINVGSASVGSLTLILRRTAGTGIAYSSKVNTLQERLVPIIPYDREATTAVSVVNH